MSRIAITGGSGASGRFIIDHLHAQGHEVVNLDRRFDRSAPGEYREVDLENYGDVLSGLLGCEKIVHFAAHPEPDFDHHTAAARFKNNTISCFNVFNAAIALGVKRVVWASSETIHGFPFETNKPKHVPITEDSEPDPQNAYAHSKLLCERLAVDLCRLNPDLTLIGLRMSNILYRSGHRDTYDRIPGYWSDPASRKFNLWGYVDARDIASAVDCALNVNLTGAHNYIIAAPDTLMKQTNQELIDAVFPGTQIDPNMGPHQAMSSSGKAERELGWTARHVWRDEVSEG